MCLSFSGADNLVCKTIFVCDNCVLKQCLRWPVFELHFIKKVTIFQLAKNSFWFRIIQIDCSIIILPFVDLMKFNRLIRFHSNVARFSETKTVCLTSCWHVHDISNQMKYTELDHRPNLRFLNLNFDLSGTYSAKELWAQSY